MKTSIDWRREWPAFVAFVIGVGVTIWLYPLLPDPMPTHWNAAGQVDGYSSRALGALLLLGTTLLIYVLLLIIPRFDPRRESIQRNQQLYYIIRLALVFFMVGLQIVMLVAVAYKHDFLVALVTPVAVGILFMLIGNYMPRMQPNWFMGIRTPWTLSDEQVWRETHRVGGRMFMVGGLAMLFAPLLPVQWVFIPLMAVILLCVLGPILYSYWLFRKYVANSSAQ